MSEAVIQRVKLSTMAATEKNEETIAQARTLDVAVPWCEQYERMISGMLYVANPSFLTRQTTHSGAIRYDSFVPELEKPRLKVRAWCNKYNSWWPHEHPDADFGYLQQERDKQLRQVMGKVGHDVYLEPPLHLDYGCNVKVGDRVYANFNLTILDCSLVTIGDRTMFGPNVSVLTATHETDVQSRIDNIEYAKPITIGADCWIGAHAVILPGVTIGEGCTIGASSVVTRDIPAWSVAMGIPARVVKTVRPVLQKSTQNTISSAVERMG